MATRYLDEPSMSRVLSPIARPLISQLASPPLLTFELIIHHHHTYHIISHDPTVDVVERVGSVPSERSPRGRGARLAATTAGRRILRLLPILRSRRNYQTHRSQQHRHRHSSNMYSNKQYQIYLLL
jgi:hypothetical protein